MLLVLSALPSPVRAEIPGLQVNPLKYEETLTTSSVKLGYIDVANPGDTNISLQSQVQAFRQRGSEGQLEFFDDSEIAAGIKVDLPKFDLGPREAVRVAFSVDPTKLPRGGVYAAIFFRTIPPAQVSNSTYVSESANIGTLLLLQNGPVGAHIGEISKLKLPFLQIGSGLTGSVTYRNTDRSAAAAGFRPALSARVFPWGQPQGLDSALVLPGSERRFSLNKSGAYLGLVPVTVTDSDSGRHRTVWVLALTGWYQWVLLVLLIGLLPVKFFDFRRLFGRRRISVKRRVITDITRKI